MTYDSEADAANPRDPAVFRTRLFTLRERWHFKCWEHVHHRDSWDKRGRILPYLKSLRTVVTDDSKDEREEWRRQALTDIDFAELMNDTGWYALPPLNG